ncbi:MAG: ribonuclease H-like domain-containing protein [Dehalococcoidales bacterium]|nr:ribonuclease H-like domain-containing protein [Dehalococcoidales bacterium]
MPQEAYLDIETTGLTPFGCEMTVAGIYLCRGEQTEFVQLISKDITANAILEALDGTDTLYTYNGSRFDLPFIQVKLGIDLEARLDHRDLMYACWRRNLYGGLKQVERRLGIPRRLPDMDGYQAVQLWWRYVENFDLDALEQLLEYNREDVVNLKLLKEKLEKL